VIHDDDGTFHTEWSGFSWNWLGDYSTPNSIKPHRPSQPAQPGNPHGVTTHALLVVSGEIEKIRRASPRGAALGNAVRAAAAGRDRWRDTRAGTVVRRPTQSDTESKFAHQQPHTGGDHCGPAEGETRCLRFGGVVRGGIDPGEVTVEAP
jgi:hypothetical protein